MAEECMNIFERDKLPLVANVEQVGRSDVLYLRSSDYKSIELCDRADSGRENTQNAGGGDGSPPRQPGCYVSAPLCFNRPHLTFPYAEMLAKFA